MPDGVPKEGANFAPSVADLVFCGVALVFALGASARLTQSDGDLFAHIRLGELILTTHQIPHVSLFGFATDGLAMVSPAWLSEVVFAALYRLGGLALIAAVVALVAGLTHGAVAWFLRHRSADARWTLIATLMSVLLGATHWLARPHAFSIICAVALILLLEWDDYRAIPWIGFVMLLWTNLHGGWVYGAGLVSLYAIGDTVDAMRSGSAQALKRRNVHLAALAVSAIATLINPYGIALHTEVLKTITDKSLAATIVEYQRPTFRVAGDIPLLIALVAGVGILIASRFRMRAAWLLVIAANILLAIQARRNIALFGVTAWPLLALQGSQTFSISIANWRMFSAFARDQARARVGIFSTIVAVVLVGIGLSGGTVARRDLIAATVSNEAFPVAAVTRMRERGLEGRIFTPWTWGGYLVFVWPDRQTFLDPLKFSAETIANYSTMLDTLPRWREQLSKWDVAIVVLPPDAPLARALATDPGWARWYADSTAVVIRRTSVRTPGAFP